MKIDLPSKFPNLEIDARISIYTHLKNEFVFIKLSFVCIAANCITCMKSNSFTPEVSVS